MLQTAQLGQLPYMNLARYVPERPPIEPAWHKALTAFLVNTAGAAGKNMVDNITAPDYSAQARALGLPGATSGDPSFASRVLHGPAWDRQALREGMQEKTMSDRYKAMDARDAERLGLSKQELDSLNKYRAEELAQRQVDQGQRDEAARRTDDYRSKMLAMEQNRLNSSNTHDQAVLNLEKQRLAQGVDPNNPVVASRLALQNAETKRLGLESDPSWQGRVKAQQMLETLKAVSPDMYNKIIGGSAPMGNNASYDPFNTGTQSVPGGQPQTEPTAVPVPTADTPPVTQSIGPADLLNAREAANQATAAGTSSQMGQSAQMQAGPVDNSPPPITQAQPLVQHTGNDFTPSDLLSLVHPPQTPNSPTAIQPSTPPAFSLPLTLDPATMRLAAEYARRQMMAGQGGLAAQAGSGGLPQASQ